jgi:O-antigen/teichoic acid export membrane protein
MRGLPVSGLARQSAANAIASGSILISGALSTIIVARLLGPADLGVVTYAAWLVSIILMVADLGAPGALARYLPEVRGQGDPRASHGLASYVYRRFILVVALAAAAVTGLALWHLWGRWTLAPGIAPETFKTSPLFWLLVAAAILTQSSLAFTIGLLRGYQAFGRMARIMLASAAAQIGVTVLGASTLGLAGALSAAVAVGLVPSLFLMRELRGGSAVAPDLRGRLMRYCGATWLAYLLSAVTWARTEILFLERSWGSEAVAFFSVGLTLANLAVQAPLLLTGPLLPVLAQNLAAEQHAAAVAIYRTGMRYLAMLVFPACFGLAAIASVFVPLVYGPAFAQAVAPAVMLVVAAAFYALTAVTQIYMNAAERNRFNILVGIVGAVSIIASGLLVIPAYGLMAAAATRTVVQVLTAAVSIWYVHRHLRAPAPISQIARIVGASALCGLAAFGLLRAFPVPAALAPAILVGALVYALALKLLGCVLPQDAERLRGIGARLLAPLAGAVSGTLRARR